jgi:hypothetical protein
MKKIILAGAFAALTAGAAFAQEPPYTVMNGQVKYPGQMQWNAPSNGYMGDTYSGSGSAFIGGPDYYVEPARGYYVERPGYVDRSEYNQYGPGIFVFDGENLNNDQNYSGM